MWRIERIILIIVALVSIGFYFQAADLPTAPFQSVGAGDFTQVLLVLLWIGMVLVYFEHRNEEKKGKSDKKPFFPPGIVQWQIITLICMVSFCALFQLLGYFTTGFLVLVVYMHFLFYAQMQRLHGVDSLKLIGIGIVTTFFLYVVFGVFFDLWLPEGILI